MKYIDEYGGPEPAEVLLNKITALVREINCPVRLMEVCGTHTMNIGRYGLKKKLPENLTLLSGPGCPVCVTPPEYLEAAFELIDKGALVTTFGDMTRVPGVAGRKLLEYSGKDVKTVYSPEDALEIAAGNPSREVVFLGVGFETTAPLSAAVLIRAEREKIDNFSCFSAHKVMPPAISLLENDPETKVDGFILPGHVSVVIGEDGYSGLNIRGAITGFEPADILLGIIELLSMAADKKIGIVNCYKRAVRKDGNKKMRDILYKVFKPCSSRWRGIGMIPGSGLKLREEYEGYDAVKKFSLEITPLSEPYSCRCGDVLKGKCLPPDCPLFKEKCQPDSPVGPCMVSSEGACSAYYRYEE